MSTVMKEHTTPLEDGAQVILHPNQIDEQDGFNPRQFFDPAEQKALEDSVKEHGVIQSLNIRQNPDNPDGYIVVTGHRRLRAAKATQLNSVPCIFRTLTDRQALALAEIENSQRADISIAEEARTARRLLDACDGDRGEVLRLLGWSASMLDSRLLLLHATESVLDALAKREIKIGHAELLAGLPAVTQDASLPKVVETGMSVQEFKSRIDGIAQSLSAAIFDTSDCNGCPNNSSTQCGLFSEALTEGQCVGRECWARKSTEALVAKKAELAETYNCVFLDTEKTPDTHTLLLRDKVGKDQFDACKGCANFGAILNSAPGLVGEVSEEVCFDLGCNAKMVAEYAAELKKADAANKTKNRSGKSGTSSAKGKSGKAKSKAVAATPKKVDEQIDKFVRQQAVSLAKRDPATVRAVSLYALLNDAQMVSELGKSSLDRHQAIAILHDMADTELDALELKAVCYQLGKQASRYDSKEHVNTAAALLKVTQTNLTGLFVLDQDFLAAHTKGGIESLLIEAHDASGGKFVPWYEAQGDGKQTLKKLLGNKVPNLIESILSSGFDFSQWVPTCITERINKIKVKANP